MKKYFVMLSLLLLMLLSTVQGAQTVIYKDNFDRIDSANLGSQWVQHNAVGSDKWNIISQKLAVPVVGSNQVATYFTNFTKMPTDGSIYWSFNWTMANSIAGSEQTRYFSANSTTETATYGAFCLSGSVGSFYCKNATTDVIILSNTDFVPNFVYNVTFHIINTTHYGVNFNNTGEKVFRMSSDGITDHFGFFQKNDVNVKIDNMLILNVTEDLPVLTLDWDTPTINFNKIFTINYNATLSNVVNTTFDCNLYDDNVLINSSQVDLTTGKSFNLNLGTVELSNTYNLTCSNNEISDDIIQITEHDTFDPRIETSFFNNSVFALVTNEQIDVNANFTNSNLINYSVIFNDGIGDVETIFADLSTLNLTFAQNITTRLATLLGGVGNYTLTLKAYDQSLMSMEVYNFQVQACPENWSPSFSSCTIGDNQTLTYTDLNSCGTTTNLPLDNGTLSVCNFCTLSSSANFGSCISGLQIISYTYDNFATCCNLTGLSSDCDLPSLTSQVCTGQYDAEDISELAVDFAGSVLNETVNWSGLLAIVFIIGSLASIILIIRTKLRGIQ